MVVIKGSNTGVDVEGEAHGLHDLEQRDGPVAVDVPLSYHVVNEVDTAAEVIFVGENDELIDDIDTCFDQSRADKCISEHFTAIE